ncbi:MAG: Fe-S cluster assembly protein HesB [Acidimicrobiia bacterium]|nr:Fe-S cluster assembly protein HesB [Acidimicrobiia bacterium]
MSTAAMPVTGDPEADALLEDDPLALLIGMLLDQQVPMEWAFRGPSTLRQRLGSHLDAVTIAEMDPEQFEALCREKPAIHRFPASMARRIQELCAHLVEHHGGDAAAVWTEATTGAELRQRLEALPGYGSEKARIFVAILGKRMGVAPDGWEEAAAPFSDGEPRSVADIDSPESLQRVREWKKAMKAKGRSKAD